MWSHCHYLSPIGSTPIRWNVDSSASPTPLVYQQSDRGFGRGPKISNMLVISNRKFRICKLKLYWQAFLQAYRLIFCERVLWFCAWEPLNQGIWCSWQVKRLNFYLVRVTPITPIEGYERRHRRKSHLFKGHRHLCSWWVRRSDFYLVRASHESRDP